MRNADIYPRQKFIIVKLQLDWVKREKAKELLPKDNWFRVKFKQKGVSL